MKKYFFLILVFSSVFLISCSSDNSDYLNGYDEGYEDGYKAGQEDTIVHAVSKEDFYPADTIGYWEGQYDMVYTVIENYGQYFPESVMDELWEMESDIHSELEKLDSESY